MYGQGLVSQYTNSQKYTSGTVSIITTTVNLFNAVITFLC